MADKKTFKWGDSEYLIDDLLSLHGNQLNHFINFARTDGKYDKQAEEGLRRAI